MKTQNKERGHFAEGIAARALEKKGYLILEKNFSNKYGEIDIIAQDHDVIVFVEVKAKTGIDFGTPEEMINRGKLQRVRNMGMIYLSGRSVPCRIDVVAIVLSRDNDVMRLSHYENVY